MIGGTELLREMDVLKAVFGPAFDPGNYRMLHLRHRHGGDHGLAAARIRASAPARRSSCASGRAISADLVHEGHG